MLRTLFKSLKTPEAADAVQSPSPPPAAAGHAGNSDPFTLQSRITTKITQAASDTLQTALMQGTQAALAAGMRARLADAPQDLEALITLGGLLMHEDPVAAAGLYARAVALQPVAAELLYLLSQSLQRQLRIDEAIAAMQLVVAAEPGIAGYRFALSMQLFLAGRYREGFLHFRARNDAQHLRHKHPWLDALPAWGGEPLTGRRILIWTDWGGLGDEIVFARYIAEVHRRYRPAALYVSCTTSMRRLMASIEGVTEAFDAGGVYPVDCHAALLDLPCIFGTDLDSIPTPVPYLHPDAADVARWKEHLPPSPGLKIGLCWSSGFWGGGTQVVNTRLNKSVPLQHLAPLCNIDGVTLVSLQKGGGLTELTALGLPLLDFDADLNDMADTAALAANLDLIIAVDTSVGHLAGALNRPTLLLLPYSSGSFYLLDTDRTPWYPGMRTLRQPRPGDWETPAARAVALVRGFAARGAVDVFA
ncbi:MAG TPA: glycosyltransferase family 9 protein [Burkholderiales bacterium]|jgi:hypothetical protein